MEQGLRGPGARVDGFIASAGARADQGSDSSANIVIMATFDRSAMFLGYCRGVDHTKYGFTIHVREITGRSFSIEGAPIVKCFG